MLLLNVTDENLIREKMFIRPFVWKNIYSAPTLCKALDYRGESGIHLIHVEVKLCLREKIML